MYDVIVTGAGPAGLTAGLYTARAGLKTLVVEKLFVGGQAATTPLLENVPGFPEGITGPDYSANMQQQAERFGCEVRYAEALSCNLTSGVKTVTVSGEPLEARSVILACGGQPPEAGVTPGGGAGGTGRKLLRHLRRQFLSGADRSRGGRRRYGSGGCAVPSPAGQEGLPGASPGSAASRRSPAG